MATSVPGLLSIEEKADGQDTGIGGSREFENPRKVGCNKLLLTASVDAVMLLL